MRALVRRFDAFLSRVHGIYAFCDEADCLLRLQRIPAPRELRLGGRVVAAGEPVLAIHLHNERIPPLPPAGPNLPWAVLVRRLFLRSLAHVAAEMRRDPRLGDVRAVGNDTTGLLTLEDPHDGGARLLERLGFTILPRRTPLGFLGEFCENFYSWVLMWAYNPGSLRGRRFSRLRRTEVWMPAGEFLAKFGAEAADADHHQR